MISKTEEILQGISDGINGINRGLGKVTTAANLFIELDDEAIKNRLSAEELKRFEVTQKELQQKNLMEVVEALE